MFDGFIPRLTMKRGSRGCDRAAADNVEFACMPADSLWLDRVEAQFTALCYVTLDGTVHAGRKAQAGMIRGYIVWRNRHADDRRLRFVAGRANVA